MLEVILENMGKVLAFLAAVVIIMLIVVVYKIEKYGVTPRVVTLYYVDWCAGCAQMKPIWAQVRAACRDSGIIFIESDEEKNRTPGVDSYPTIMMINEYGVREQYRGGADYGTLHNWVKGKRNFIL